MSLWEIRPGHRERLARDMPNLACPCDANSAISPEPHTHTQRMQRWLAACPLAWGHACMLHAFGTVDAGPGGAEPSFEPNDGPRA